MNNVLIEINKKTRQVFLTNSVIGNDGENLQENLVFSFNDEFVDGTGRLELIKPDKEKSYIMLEKIDETYQIPVKSIITKGGRLTMQLVITQGTDPNAIPIFKSNKFYVVVNSSINFLIEEPDEYPQWIDVANTKLNEIDEAIQEASNLDIDVNKEDNVATITLTDKEGQTKEVQILDGEQGPQGIQGETGPAGADGIDGQDATINGVNTINIEAGENITLEQQGSILTINSTGGDGKVKSVNGKTGDVVLKTSDLQNDSNFITNLVDDLTNYYLKSEIYTKSEVNTLIGNIQQFHYEVVQTLPTTGENNILYLVPKATSQTNNIYDEYVYSNGWEKIGDTEIDLTNYVQKTDYASGSNAGVIKTTQANSFGVDTGIPYCYIKTYQQYTSGPDTSFIGKGTLENVITGKELVSSNDLADVATSGDYDDLLNKPDTSLFEQIANKVSTIDSSSTNIQYAGAKAVWDLIGGLSSVTVGNTGTSFVFADRDIGIYTFPNISNPNFPIYKTSTSSSINIGARPLILNYYKKIDGTEIPSSDLYIADALVLDNNNYMIKVIRYYIDTTGNLINTSSSSGMYLLSPSQFNQTIGGLKTFSSIPRVNSYTAPTTDTQLTAKKYVDDSIANAVGSINTILATLTTPGGNE